MTATGDPCRAWVQLEHEVVAAYRAGTPATVLRARHGIGTAQMKGILARAGIVSSPKGGRRRQVSDEVEQEMYRLADEGRTNAEIGALTGWTSGAVYRALQRRGG